MYKDNQRKRRIKRHKMMADYKKKKLDEMKPAQRDEIVKTIRQRKTSMKHMERNIYDRVVLGVPKLLRAVDKLGIKKNISKDLKKAKEHGGGYDSFDEEWIIDRIRSEDKVYYGSDSDIS
tara:strand:+ start:232 stop:591 length:360 start_codon:yes stop_codon:yes gene_type:complete